MQSSVEKALGRLGDLPAIPAVVGEVLRITADPDCAISDVSRVVERDPALTAKLLKVSNSPYYGMKQIVGTLKLALVILGVREVRNIVLGVTVLESMRDRRTERLLERYDFWNHSAMVAGLSKKIGTHFRLNLEGEDFIAGLLHDVGKMVLWRHLGENYERVFEQSGGCSERLCEAESAMFHFDHADAAAALAHKWNMPQTLADAMYYHHERDGRHARDAKDPRLAALVQVANQAARDLWDGEGEPASRGAANDSAWDLITSGRGTPDQPERARLLKTFYHELKEEPAPQF